MLTVGKKKKKKKKNQQGTYHYSYLVVISIAIYLIGHVFFFRCTPSVLDKHSFFPGHCPRKSSPLELYVECSLLASQRPYVK